MFHGTVNFGGYGPCAHTHFWFLFSYLGPRVAWRERRTAACSHHPRPAPCHPPEAVNLRAMREMKRFKCLVAVLALGGADALISPSLGGGGGGFSKRTTPAVRASVPIDQLREALITSKAFADLVERLERQTIRDGEIIDAAQAKFGFDPPANGPSNDRAAPSGNMAAGAADRSFAAASPSTIGAAATASSSAASELSAKLSSQQEKAAAAAAAAPGSPAAATTVASPSAQSDGAPPAAQAAPKAPAFNLFGLGNGKKSSPPKQTSGFMKATPEDVAEAQAAAAKAKEEERQVHH